MQLNSKNTNRVYETSYRLFIQNTNLSEIEIQSMDILDLAKQIESVFTSSSYSVNSKLTRISACKNFISEKYNKDFPKSRKLKHLSKQKNRRSNKIDLSTSNVKKLIKLFETEYKSCQTGYKPIKLRNLILIKLLTFTGQRIGDLLSITVNKAKQTKLFFKQEKTGAEVTIDNPCLPEIMAYINIVGLTDEQPLFSTGLNKTLSYTYVNNLISKVGLKIGIDKLTCHVFRKYAVTHLKEVGLSDRQVMSITGHSDNRMIGYYTGDSKQVDNLQKLLLQEV